MLHNASYDRPHIALMNGTQILMKHNTTQHATALALHALPASN
jgi:hypothetical protein